MRLLEYLNRFVSALPKSNGKRNYNQESYRSCATSVKAFLGEKEDIDILAALNPDWVNAYKAFLSAKYEKGTTNTEFTTAARHYNRFRTMMRAAIRDGFIPNIDIFPSIESASADKDRAIEPFDYNYQLRRLLLKVSKEGLRDKPLLLYLFGIFCYGLEIKEILDFTIHHTDDSKAKKIECRGIQAELPAIALAIAELYNNKKIKPGHLFPVYDDTDTEEEKNQKAADIEREIRLSMKDGSIDLMRSSSIFSDWLGLIAQNPSNKRLACDILACLQNKSPLLWLQLLPQVQQEMPTNDYGYLARRWYVLICHSPRLRADKLKAKFLQSKIVATTSLEERHFYDPFDKMKVRVKGRERVKNHPAVSGLLFFNGYIRDAQILDAYDATAWVLREPGERQKYGVIPDEQVKVLRVFLRDRIDDLDLVEYREDDERNYTKGTRVTLLTPPYEGLEGIIEEIKEKSTVREEKTVVKRLFTVNIGDKFSFQLTDLHGLEFQPI